MNFVVLALGIMFIASIVTFVILMVLDEPPGFEPYEQESIDDFGDGSDTQ